MPREDEPAIQHSVACSFPSGSLDQVKGPVFPQTSGQVTTARYGLPRVRPAREPWMRGQLLLQLLVCLVAMVEKMEKMEEIGLISLGCNVALQSKPMRI